MCRNKYFTILKSIIMHFGCDLLLRMIMLSAKLSWKQMYRNMYISSNLQTSLVWTNTVDTSIPKDDLSGLFTYPNTCLGTNYDLIYIESVSLIRIFTYPDSQLGDWGVRISEAPLYPDIKWVIFYISDHNWFP